MSAGMPNYFEITVTGRQMAGAVAGVAVLIFAAFGIGIVVGGRGHARSEATGSELVAVAPEPPVRGVSPLPAVTPTAAADAVPLQVATPGTASPAGPATVAPIAALASPTASPAPSVVRPTPAPTRPAAPAPAISERYAGGEWVQVGALVQAAAAEKVRRRVLELGYTPAQVVVQLGEDGKYRVRVGPLPDAESARRVADRLRAHGFAGAFLVKR